MNVRDVQAALVALGYSLVVDGKPGPRTKAARSSLLLDVMIEIRDISAILGSGKFRLERIKDRQRCVALPYRSICTGALGGCSSASTSGASSSDAAGDMSCPTLATHDSGGSDSQ